MFGPRPIDFWTTSSADTFGPLASGRAYRVTHPFYDQDGTLHPAGEVWTYLGHSYQPAEDSVSFYVSLDGLHSWLVPMEWLEQSQGPVLDSLEDFLTELRAAMAA